MSSIFVDQFGLNALVSEANSLKVDQFGVNTLVQGADQLRVAQFGLNVLISESSAAVSPGTLIDLPCPTKWYWLLEIDFAGRTFRWGTEEVVVFDLMGRKNLYESGLSVTLEQSLDLLSETPDRLSVGFDLFFSEDLSSLVAEGHDLSGAFGRLYRWHDGAVKEKAELWISGEVDAPSYETDFDSASFQLIDRYQTDDTSLVIPVRANVSDDTFGDYDEGIQNANYPFVFGSPGHIEQRTVAYVNGSPGLFVELTNDYVLIAGHEVLAQAVIVENFTSSTRWACLVRHAEDLLGRKYAYIEMPGTNQEGDSFFVRWVPCEMIVSGLSGVPQVGFTLDGATSGATAKIGAFTDLEGNDLGLTVNIASHPKFIIYVSNISGEFEVGETLQNFGGTATLDAIPFSQRNQGHPGMDGQGLRRAGQLLNYIYSKSSADIDRGRVEIASKYLDQITVSGYIDESEISWLDWAEDNLLPILPVSILSGPSGVYPSVFRAELRSQDAGWFFVEGLNCTREAEPRYQSTGEQINEFRLDWGVRISDDVYRRSRTISGSQDYGRGNLFTRRSYSRIGEQSTSEISDIIYSQTTAGQYFGYQSKIKSGSKVEIDYALDRLSCRLPKPGDIVSLTDSGLGFSGALGHVLSIEIEDLDVFVTVLLIR
jgi:hypothetical protein